MGYPINAARYAAGAPVDNPLFTDIIAQLGVLTGQESGAANACDAPPIPNGSFEIDPDTTVQPTRWTFAPATGGSGQVTTNDSSHGQKSYRVIHPGGAGNGGGTLTLTDYLPCGISQSFTLLFDTKATLPDIETKVLLRWLDGTKAKIGEDITMLDINGTYPSTWTTRSVALTPVTAPSPARFFRIAFVLGDTSVDPGASTYIYLDNVVLLPQRLFTRYAVFTTTGTWTVPVGVNFVKFRMVGGGGGGGGNGNRTPGGGGGYVEGFTSVTPGAVLAYTVGAGGYKSDGGASAFGGVMALGGQEGGYGAAGGNGYGPSSLVLSGMSGLQSLQLGGQCGMGFFGGFGRGGVYTDTWSHGIPGIVIIEY